jgi:hypothetical protein
MPRTPAYVARRYASLASQDQDRNLSGCSGSCFEPNETGSFSGGRWKSCRPGGGVSATSPGRGTGVTRKSPRVDRPRSWWSSMKRWVYPVLTIRIDVDVPCTDTTYANDPLRAIVSGRPHIPPSNSVSKVPNETTQLRIST